MNEANQTVRVPDIKASIDLYDDCIKPGCNKLLELNKYLLASERNQRKKQVLYRLAWVGGLSTLVIAISYLTIGINMITAVGLLAAYMAGILLHHKYSPKVVLPEQEEELYRLNDDLRSQISDFERERPGILHKLLELTNQQEKAESQGIRLEGVVVDLQQLNGSGLYQYLDGMNLVFDNRNVLDERLTK
ncbi:hypothetical protein [Vibrio sp. HN007]|uniref:hypothetical protein n=1 Tax=Vibrio iocasae TaxID=3098914 RepID=UPI0035D43C6E